MSIASELTRLENAKDELIDICSRINGRDDKNKWIPMIEGGGKLMML